MILSSGRSSALLGLPLALTALVLMAAHHLLERRAVVQVHLLERFVDLLENTIELVWLDMCLNNGQDSAELLILLFEA